MTPSHDDGSMITTTAQCRRCGSQNIVANGHNRSGSQQYRCKDCRASGVVTPKIRYPPERQEEILRAYQERPSMRGIERIFGVARQTLAAWLKKKFRTPPTLRATLLPVQADDRLELDEVWSFVRKRVWKRWLWVALCRRTRQVIAFVIGDRSERTCRRLWRRIPAAYRRCVSFSDFWDAYAAVFPVETHRCVGKETGETAHIERWNNTLRQRVGRYVRKTLSFSKRDRWHYWITKWFIIAYNLRLSFTN
jgi:insertion element IS1 protein InsB